MTAGVAFDARDAVGPELRGWGRYARDLLAALERRTDVDVHAVAGAWPGPELVWEQVALPRILRREQAALVHAPNCFLPLRRPCPGVVSIHDLAWEEYPEDFARTTGWKYRTFAPRAARSAERVICISEFTRDDVARRYGVSEEKLRVIGAAPSLAIGTGEPPAGPYILAVGDLRRKKNFGRLVEAFGRLREDGLEQRLVIAGRDAGEAARLRAPGVELPGYVSDEQLDALMRGADLLVHPSLYEGFGLVIVEAMARGTPVAAARATALPETGGDAALYFDPLDVADIAATITRALGEAGLGERGRAHVANLSWDHTAARTAAVYRELL
ncbi:MAG TPA: glycosyltransferase family 1 protein [Thermoleophilaceae bacterium]|nr:glycosyltransferase family 1 protein [Thermoleophilaceae bacterium]